MINIPPRMRVRSTPKKAGRNSHCVTHQGTKPASPNGAMTKNRAEPKTAIAFDIACSHDPARIALANRIAHIAIETRHHEVLRRCDRRRRAQSLQRKACKRVDKPG